MRPDIYWIDQIRDARLAIMPKPRADDWLEDEIIGWRAEGIDVVVSLLENNEVNELDLDREATLCLTHGIDFRSFPVADRGVPQSQQAAITLVRQLSDLLLSGKAVAIHCRAGIGRSSVIAACVLIHLGFGHDEALEAIAIARRVPVPDTTDQRAWVKAFAEQPLNADRSKE